MFMKRPSRGSMCTNRVAMTGEASFSQQQLASCSARLAQSVVFLDLGRLLAKGPRFLERHCFRIAVTQHLAQNFVGMLAEQRRPLDLCGGFGELDRHADVEPFAA